MGETAAETVREIEETRERLDSELRELEERLPTAKWAKRVAGLALGGGVGGTAFWMVVKRARRRKKQKEKEEAEAVRLQAVVNVLPEKLARSVSEAFEDGRWKPWALAAGGVWLVLRLAELRQLRRMNRIMVARSASL